MNRPNVWSVLAAVLGAVTWFLPADEPSPEPDESQWVTCDCQPCECGYECDCTPED